MKKQKTAIVVVRPFGECEIIIFNDELSHQCFAGHLIENGQGFLVSAHIVECLGQIAKKAKKNVRKNKHTV